MLNSCRRGPRSPPGRRTGGILSITRPDWYMCNKHIASYGCTHTHTSNFICPHARVCVCVCEQSSVCVTYDLHGSHHCCSHHKLFSVFIKTSNILHLRCLCFSFGSLVSDPPALITSLIFSPCYNLIRPATVIWTIGEMSCVANDPLFDCRGHTKRSIMSIRQPDGWSCGLEI